MNWFKPLRRLVALLAFLAAFSADSGPTGRGGGLTCPSGYVGGGLTPCTPAYAFFEFAPASGAGMGTACACAAVTGVKGEALTLTRASVAECYSNDGQTLTQCGNNLPRVSSGSAASS